MNERIKKGLINSIAAKRGENPESVLTNIRELLNENPEISRAEIFRIFTADFGIGKNHLSGEREGEILSTHRNMQSSRKRRKKW